MRQNERGEAAPKESLEPIGTPATTSTSYTIRESLTVAGPERDLSRLLGAIEVVGTLKQTGIRLNLTDVSVHAGDATFAKEECTLKLGLEAPRHGFAGVLAQLSRKFPRLLFHLHAETYDGSTEQLCLGGDNLVLVQEPWTECEDWDDMTGDKTVTTSPDYDAQASLCASLIEVQVAICREGKRMKSAAHLAQGLLARLTQP